MRNNRIARPSGARPQPSSGRRQSDLDFVTTRNSTEQPAASNADPTTCSISFLSHRRAQSALSNNSSVTSESGRLLAQQQYPGATSRDYAVGVPVTPLKPSEVVPSATYMERGQRWMEKEEAVALRGALKDMDLTTEEEEEMRLHAAAQDEASELVYQHQNPGAAAKPAGPYRYTDHLRKNSYQHARTQSVGRYGGIGMVTGLARDIPRSVSGGSSSSNGMNSQRSRVSSGFSGHSKLDRNTSPGTVARESMESSREVLHSPSHKSYGSISTIIKPQSSSRRRSSSKRNISGEIAVTFTGEQIWEEPEEGTPDRGRVLEAKEILAPLRVNPKNPLNRVQFAEDMHQRPHCIPSQPTKKLSVSEIHQNPPSQSRNPAYTSNPSPIELLETEGIPKKQGVAEKDSQEGLEVRSDEIRQVTSMRLKDRSFKLPKPTVVSGELGRPIVSFDKNWMPREADDKPEGQRRSKLEVLPLRSERQSIPAHSNSTDFTTPIPTIQIPDASSVYLNHARAVSTPIIDLPESSRSVPSINLPDAPSISVAAPEVPTISIEPSNPNSSNGKRLLPDPNSASRRPARPHATAPVSKSHWTPTGKGATVTCHQCQLKIEGRVVALRGAIERFHPHCFVCFTCGTGLEALEISPEPDINRSQRIDRIQRRAYGEKLAEIEGQTMAEDGDEKQRYFCHLDWHENFAPRCKHCTTPIIGEHTIALGDHWHFGHFFCAECGDAFEKGMSHIEKDGYAWCLKCQTKRTERRAPKCLKCKQPVIGEYVQAMGGEWHDRCFRCINCKGGFEDGSYFPKEVGNEMVVVCQPCMERELKA